VRDSPWHELVAGSEDYKLPLTDLPGFLKITQSGNTAEIEKLILALHRRLHHKPPEELRVILAQAGVPLHVLSQVKAIVDGCDNCRMWQKSHSKPVVKIRQAPRFNHTTYSDLAFFTDFTVLVTVDEALRYTMLVITPSKTEEDLEACFRRGWGRQFGASQVFRADSESAFASDAWGLFCERSGMQRQLCNVSDGSHTWLGIIDRRIQMLRFMIPKIYVSLAEDYLVVDPADVVAEAEFCLNTQLQYNGFSPYHCLYGHNPVQLLNDETEHMGQLGSQLSPYFEHAAIRAHATAAFQQALVQQGLARVNKARYRPANQTSYRIGQWCDVWRKPVSKEATGWRGPCVVVQVIGEGFLSLRWQGTTFDAPIHHIRPHALAVPTNHLADSGFAVPPLQRLYRALQKFKMP
jgi:hypothetical protein